MKDLVLRRPDARGDVLPMPTTVQPLLERRLNALAPPASDVLRVAAIMGSDLTPPRVATVLQRSLAEVQAGLAALESANVFQGLAFIHDLLRECALQRTAPAERVALHGAVAQVLSGDPQVPPGRLAFHWEAAERWPEAGAALYAAGLAARLAGRLEEQRSLLLRSAECWQRVGNRSAEFESRHASMESVLVRQGPTAVLEELPSLQAIAVTPEQELKLLILRAEALVHLMRRDEALQVSTEAVRRGEQHPSLLADALGIHGMVLAQCGRLDEAVEAEQRAADCAQRSGTAPQAIRVTHTQVYVLYEAGRIGEAIAAARTSARLTRESGDVGETAQVEGNLSTLLALAGDPAGCYEMARRVRAQHQAMGSTTNSILGGMNLLSLGSSAAYLGRFDEALDALTAGVQMLGDGTPIAARTKARVVMANLWLTLGAPEQAAGVLPQLSVDVPPAMQVQWHWAQARIEAMAGRPAEPHLRRMGEIQDANTSLPLVQSAWLEWSRQGDAAMVIDRLRPIRSECERLGLPGTARSLLLREIDRLTEIDSDDAVAQAVRLAASLRDTLAQGMHATTYVPEAWAILARAFENAGQRGDGAACSDEGRHWIEACVRDHLPASVKESFLDRNPVNRALMRAQPAVTP